MYKFAVNALCPKTLSGYDHGIIVAHCVCKLEACFAFTLYRLIYTCLPS